MAVRFYESPPWRFLVTNLNGTALTFLDKLASRRTLTRTLNEPLRIECTVPSDNPEVYLAPSGSSIPFVHEGNRLLYALRRENTSEVTDVKNWVCRGAGIIMEITDNGDANVPTSDVTALDPWALLYRRPCVNSDATLPDHEGMRFAGVAGSAIAMELLDRTAVYHGPTHLDIVSGEIEDTELVTIDLDAGESVGEAWDALVETGTMDIVLDPVYDPIDRPGVCAVVNIYARAGSDRRGAIFAWDRPSRSVVNLGRTRDGEERANKVQFYIGQGGPPVPQHEDDDSITRYGEYWQQQFFPGHDLVSVVNLLAAKHLNLRKDGLHTYTLSPAPERSPVPFIDYDIGDTIPIHASSRFREPVDALRRVISIPLAIGDDQLEAPSEILVSEEEEVEVEATS